jgi:hypothetical protein
VVVTLTNGPKYTRFAGAPRPFLFECSSKAGPIPVDDGTACFSCMLWHAAAAEGDGEAERWEELELGKLLRVQGRLSHFNDCLECHVHVLVPVTDPNEECLHWLRALENGLLFSESSS